jgi:hypothetical protein
LMLTATAGTASAVTFLTIVPTFNDSSLSPADSANFRATINTAINFYHTNLATLNPVTVSITFEPNETVSLGQSSTYVNGMSYADFRAALVNRSSSASDATSLANIPLTNPLNAGNVRAALPLLRSLGVNILPPGADTDSTISFKTSLMQLSRGEVLNPLKYDLLQVAYHEINEVLGFSSALNGLMNGDPAPTASIGSLDIFRFTAPGVRRFDTVLGSAAYMSIDGGVTNLTAFNTTGGGDYQDFETPGGSQVQDAFSSPGFRKDNGIAELAALDVIGYTLVPEPGSMVFLSLGAVFMMRRRRA